VAEAKGLIEQARAAEAERAKVAAEEAAAAAAVAAAERLQMEEEMAALALRLQQMQAQLGVPPAAPAPHAEETLRVVCMDAAKDRAVRPCMHVCLCETCASLLMLEKTPRCPVCREPIQHIERVFL
jgi:hypothetical protein